MKHIIYSTMILILLFVTAISADPIDLSQKVSLQLDEIPITTVLHTLAQQYELNLVQSSEIEGNLTLRLNEVTLENALKSILNANAYNYYLAGDIIVVKPIEFNAVEEIVVKALTLDYITPLAAQNAAQDLLSTKGKIKVIEDAKVDRGIQPRSTRLVIIDFPEHVDIVTRFIKSIDNPEPQIAIEVRMIETNFDSEQKAGFKWPTSLTARVHGLQTVSTSTTTEGSSTQALGQIDLPDGKWEWGKLSVNELQVVLDFLESEGNSKLISDPRITTLNNHEAEIKVTTIIPIQTLNRFSEGGSVQDIVSYQDEEVGITLLVTPHVTKDNKIILDVNPTVAEIVGYTGPPDQQKPITSERSVRTKITVADGESAVLGGLLKENKIENEQRLFFLGSIPILGGLFKHKTVQTSTTDLTILITPQIIKE